MRSQGILHIFRSPIHWAHRAVIFATARLSWIKERQQLAMLSAVLAIVNPSVRLSVTQSGTVSKRLKLGSWDLQWRIAHDSKVHREVKTKHSLVVSLNIQY